MISPYIYEKTKDGDIMYDVFSRLVKDRIIFLSGEVTEEMATNAVATLLYLDAQNSSKQIDVYINSPGGVVTSGLFPIIDTMNYIKSEVATYCIGEAASAAAVILSAGTKGKRHAFENSEVMIHQAIGGAYGSTPDIKIRAEQIDKINKRIFKILAKNVGKTVKELETAMDRDKYLTAEEAKKFGIIDKIIKQRS